ncbi:thiolase family protein [Sphingomonas sp. A2-49]|uniref:thiolase family protein n=1 Tax=Sphingomonas sp. A2-49 TaxID=1391375 RepID=UPI0021CE6FBC|nr:thiolase family protein [Sphingomonas sp. A2-49]MCU6453129.1 thiolase family protein [Sphingomonas sp. A2-49]
MLPIGAAITGIGQSEVARPSSRSAMQLTVDAALEAMRDAGLTSADIDGVACWPGDNDNGNPFSPVGPLALKTVLGIETSWFGGGYEAPGPLAAVIHAVMAVASGVCRHVLVFRTITESSARKVDRTVSSLSNKTQGRDSSYFWQWYTPFDVRSAINLIAMYAQRHFHEYGTTSEQLGWIPVTLRSHAALNPKAIYRKPITIDDYLASRMISTPLRLLDCDVHCDASTAIIVSRADAARDGPNPPIRVEAIGSALSQPWSWDQISLTEMATRNVGDMLWSRTDYTPADVDTAQLYDGFSILTLMWLEGLGLCPRGEGGRFVEGGTRIGLTGELPLNTNGGQLSGGRTHGLGYVHEACMQLWGRAGNRQIAKHDVAACAAGGGPLGGALLLVKD